MAEDITVEILRDIRDELRTTRTELKEELATTRSALRTEIASTRVELSTRIDSVEERVGSLERRQTESELRLASEIVAVVGAINEVRDLLEEALALGPRVADHELRIRALESSAPHRE